MKILFFDTETTGKAFFRLPSTHPSQPRMVSLGAILTDGVYELASLDLTIKPDGFEIPDEAAAIHGITNERANALGIPILSAIYLLSGLVALADRCVAHNIQFDQIIVERESLSGFFGKRPLVCTMDAMTPIPVTIGSGSMNFPQEQVRQFAELQKDSRCRPQENLVDSLFLKLSCIGHAKCLAVC